MKGIDFVTVMSIGLPEGDLISTERGKEMCAVVYHPETKKSLDWTVKTRRDM
jgi:hypothetical protein